MQKYASPKACTITKSDDLAAQIGDNYVYRLVLSEIIHVEDYMVVARIVTTLACIAGSRRHHPR